MKVYEKAQSLCEEFTDDVLFDKTRLSLVVNVKREFFGILKKELSKLKYELVFTKSFDSTSTITCGFQLK